MARWRQGRSPMRKPHEAALLMLFALGKAVEYQVLTAGHCKDRCSLLFAKLSIFNKIDFDTAKIR